MKTAAPWMLSLSLMVALVACRQTDTGASAAAAPAPAPASTSAPAVEAKPEAAVIAIATGNYRMDPPHTLVVAQWNHFGFSNPMANFGQVDGVIHYNAEDVTQSSVQATLPLAGLTGFTAAFDEHLRSADFFEAARFPSATFKSTKVAAAGVNKLTVTGDLTIKDITRQVVLDVTVNGAGPHPSANKPAVGFDATTTLKRSDFGVGAYAPTVSDEVSLRITTEAIAE